MMIKLNLQLFAEGPAAPAGGAEASGAEAAPASGAETAAAEVQPGPIAAGDTLPDGSRVADARVAAALEKQMKRHPELRNVYGKGQPVQTEPAAAEQPAEKSPEERWNEIRNGEFKEFYGRDVQNAIQDRFKNQKAAADELNKFEPMLKVLRDRAGVDSNDALMKQILDDDSLYEEEANAKGMTVPAYREFMQMQQRMEEIQQREQESIRENQLREHFGRLQQQAEAMKQLYPDFDLQKELQNPAFLRMTSPEGGISVEDAYYAIHHKELAPQMMAYGMQRAKQQMGQTIQAQRQRPVEGAMRQQGQPAAEVKIDPRNLTKQERKSIRRRVMELGEKVSFD